MTGFRPLPGIQVSILWPLAYIAIDLLAKRAPFTMGGFRNAHKIHFLPHNFFLSSSPPHPPLDLHLRYCFCQKGLNLVNFSAMMNPTHLPAPPSPSCLMRLQEEASKSSKMLIRTSKSLKKRKTQVELGS